MAPDLASYITSANDNALGYSASSPQATTFGHQMAVSACHVYQNIKVGIFRDLETKLLFSINKVSLV